MLPFTRVVLYILFVPSISLDCYSVNFSWNVSPYITRSNIKNFRKMEMRRKYLDFYSWRTVFWRLKTWIVSKKNVKSLSLTNEKVILNDGVKRKRKRKTRKWKGKIPKVYFSFTESRDKHFPFFVFSFSPRLINGGVPRVSCAAPLYIRHHCLCRCKMSTEVRIFWRVPCGYSLWGSVKCLVQTARTGSETLDSFYLSLRPSELHGPEDPRWSSFWCERNDERKQLGKNITTFLSARCSFRGSSH